MTRRFEGQKLKSLRITLKAKLTLERVKGKLIYLWHSCIRIYIILDKIWQWTYNIFSFFFRSQRINFNSFNGYCYDEFLFYSKLLCRWEEWFINFKISNVKFIVPFRHCQYIRNKIFPPSYTNFLFEHGSNIYRMQCHTNGAFFIIPVTSFELQFVKTNFMDTERG